MGLFQVVSAGTSQYPVSAFQLLIQLESQGQECVNSMDSATHDRNVISVTFLLDQLLVLSTSHLPIDEARYLTSVF